VTPLLTIAEAAKRLRISITLMRRLVWSNQIGYVDLNRGGTYIKARFTEEHLRDYMKRNEVKAS
jgi:excisionase family DNA binding protein